MEQKVSSTRLLVWTAFFLPHVGGYEKNILELFRRLVERGYQVDVVTCQMGNLPAIEVMDGVRVKRIPSLLLLNGLYPVPLPSRMLLGILIGGRGYDVVITQTRFFVLSFIGAAFSILYRIPLIHVERGSCHTIVTNPLISLISKIYDHVIGSWIMRTAKQVVGVSGSVCEFAEHLGVRWAVRIPNGVTIPIQHFNIGEHPPTQILYVGRLIRAKGIQDLIAAITQVGGGRCYLTIVGDGPYKEQLQEITNNNSVCFLGELVGEQLLFAYQHADVFCNPSYSEGLPTAVMEAAVFGIPIIATNVGGTGEIIQAGVTGLLVEPGDVDGLERAISWMLDNKKVAKKMAEACRERVLELYSWDEVTNQYCELLEGINEDK